MEEKNSEKPFSDLWEDLNKDTPTILKPMIRLNQPHDNIIIYSGEINFHTEETLRKTEGQIYFRWLPYPQVAVAAKPAKGHTIYLRDELNIKIAVPGVLEKTKLIITELGGRGLFGQLSGQILSNNKETLVDTIHFELANFRGQIGHPVVDFEDGKGFHGMNRLVFEDDEYEIIVDTLKDYKDRLVDLRNAGTYHLLNTGRIKPKISQYVPYIKLNKVLHQFSVFLRFFHGRRCSPLFRTGIKDGEVIIQDYTPYITDPYKFVLSWVPEISPIESCKTWRSFRSLYENENNKECLDYILHWYVEACNNSGMGIGAIILAQNALELLCNWAVERGIIPEGRNNEPFSAKLTRLLEAYRLPLLVPESCRHIRLFLENETDLGRTGPEILTFLRNAYVHANVQKRTRLREYSEVIAYDGLELALWYVEVLLLKMLNYNGPYRNRTSGEQYINSGIENFE